MQRKWTTDECDDLYNNYSYYIDHKKEAKEIFERSFDAIHTKAYRLGVTKKQFNSNLSILQEPIKSYIYGLLLSDGFIETITEKTGRYIQCCKYKEWLEKVCGAFGLSNISCMTNHGRFAGGFSNAFLYTLRTSAYKELHELKHKWYVIDDEWYDNKNKVHRRFTKVIPSDLELTPGCIANWYLGDGSISKVNGTNSFRIHLATMNFSRDEVILLSELLTELDIKNITAKDKTIWINRKKSVERFINYIYEYKISCYNYKFPDELIDYQRHL